jgi:APA family basic amino acid/polyamine antiporter
MRNAGPATASASPSPPGSGGELLRILGIGFGLAVVVGGVVGQGIMRTPGIVAGALPSGGAIMAFWVLGAAIILLDACATVEVGTSIPCAGGPYVFARRAFGPFAGTMMGWADWLNLIIAVSYVSVVFGEYAQRLGLGESLPTGALAIALLAAIFAVNWIGTRVCGASQMIGTALKGLGLAILVGLLLLAPGHASSPVAASTPVFTVAAFAVAMRAVAITYAGWNTSVYFCEEIHAPERNIVRATFGGIGLVALLYLAVNAALLHALTRDQIAASKLPVADAAAAALGPASGTVITLLAIVSVVAIANLFMMYASRVAFAMARNRVLPAPLASVSASGSPRLALACTAGAAAVLASSGGYERLIAIGAPFTFGVVAMVDLAAIRVRLAEPDLPRPFRMPLFPLPALVGLAVNLLLMAAVIYEDPLHSMIGLAVLLAIGIASKLRALTLPPIAPAASS